MHRAFPAAALALVGCATDLAAQHEWRLLPARSHNDHPLAYDANRDRLVAFSDGRTLEWDGQEWQVRVTATAPSPRAGSAMVYDPGRGCMLLFGGRLEAVLLGDLWQYDGTDWQAIPFTGGPSARELHAMAFDEQRGRLVLCGGGNEPAGSVWEWDRTQWRLLQPTGPAAASGLAMAYDRGRGVAVVVQRGASTHEWNGTSWRTVAGSPMPNAEYRACYADDRARVQAYTVGSTALHEWDGATWTAVTPPVAPPTRAKAGLAYDQRQRRTILFGGGQPMSTVTISSDTKWRGDTWEFHNGQWTELHGDVAQTTPSNECTFDLLRGVLVRYFGADSRASVNTWEWDGVTWTHIPGPTPPGMIAQVAFDPLRAATVCFGGTLLFTSNVDQTWLWSGGVWSRVLPQTVPPARVFHDMVFSWRNGGVVMFGGAAGGTRFGDTWLWNGTDWRLLAATGPSPRTRAALVERSATGDIVLFGGQTGAFSDETWLFDGQVWTLAAVPQRPPARIDPGLAYDPLRDRVVLVNGFDNVGVLRDTWEFDGSGWQPNPAPAPGTVGNAIFFPPWSRVVLLASRPATTELWVYSPIAAQAEPFGTGCGGATVPQLASLGLPSVPQLGFAFDLTRAPANRLFGLGFGLSAASAPLGSGCALLIAQEMGTTLGVTNASGFASVPARVPNLPVLLGAALFAQAGVLDPQLPFGAALTAGLRLRFGD